MTRSVNFLGDSITAQLGPLADWFGAGGIRFVNAGIGGQTSGQILARVGTDVNATASDRCVVLCGINDILQGAGFNDSYISLIPPGTVTNGHASIGANIQAICEDLAVRGITAYPCTLTPVCVQKSSVFADGTYTATQINTFVGTLNTWIAAFATANGLTLIDHYPHFVGGDGFGRTELFQTDGLHPNDYGRSIRMALAGTVLNGGAPWWVAGGASALRDLPAGSGATVVTFSGVASGAVKGRNVSLATGSPGYTGTGMTNSAMYAVARGQEGIVP